MNLNCLIVDDEPIARDILQNYIDKIPQLTLIKSCMSATEAYEAIYEHPIDLIFLDIQMPVITGIEFLKSLSKAPIIIFTTAYSDFAVEGFTLNAIDYLLKPITFERFYQAIEKVLEKVSAKKIVEIQNVQEPDYIFIRQDYKLLRLNFSEIDYIKAEKDFCSIYFKGKRLLASMHLGAIAVMLPSQQFVRIHRSFLVNLKKITAIKGNVIEIETEEIPIGSNHRDELFNRLKI
ncbi:LytR/AlgR family response regulator transcription factor [Pedobacter sp. UBA5917]|jgi:DNA-binding LytR/AlgR family response regulator|uniref:LytR/AlgR family response regulator transcription factor n=1 Tax=Pedobacter sp. UBA5917 TaxID=1947061 RepID=UPI0025F4BE17|nr:response regulator transcription factor [Pedobacter sp. UBA5917]